MPAPQWEGYLTLGRSGVGLSSNHGDGEGYAVQSMLNVVRREPEGLSVAHTEREQKLEGWGTAEGKGTTMT